VHGTIAVENPFGCKQSFASSAKEVDVAVTCSNQGPSTDQIITPATGGPKQQKVIFSAGTTGAQVHSVSMRVGDYARYEKKKGSGIRPTKSDDDEVITVYAAPNRSLHSTVGSAVEPASLANALRLASTATHAGAAAVVQLLPGRYQLDNSISVPSRVTLRGQVGAETTLSGGVPITGWAAVPGKPWLFVSSLPTQLAGSCVNQLFVAGQRRAPARSATMRFNKVLPHGLHTTPGQLLPHYANVSAMRVITWQHWTTVIDKVESIGALDIQFSTGPPATYTGVPR
jgi:hypothetical protein